MNRYIVASVPGIAGRYYVLDLVDSVIASVANSLDIANHIADGLNRDYDANVSAAIEANRDACLEEQTFDSLSPDHKLGLQALSEYHQDPNKLALDALCDDGGICD